MPDMQVWADDQGITLNLERETDSMLDYYRGHGKQMADWPATWRNWMKRAQDYAEQSKPKGSRFTDELKAATKRLGAVCPGDDYGNVSLLPALKKA